MLWLDGMKAGTKHANIPDVVLKFRMTDSLFKKRRNGWAFAKKQLEDRKMINRTRLWFQRHCIWISDVPNACQSGMA